MERWKEGKEGERKEENKETLFICLLFICISFFGTAIQKSFLKMDFDAFFLIDIKKLITHFSHQSHFRGINYYSTLTRNCFFWVSYLVNYFLKYTHAHRSF
jgi:hypothetical protein